MLRIIMTLVMLVDERHRTALTTRLTVDGVEPFSLEDDVEYR